MLSHSEAHNGTDREIAAAVARIQKLPLIPEQFTKNRRAAEQLQALMCPDRKGELSRVATEEGSYRPSFTYVFGCRDRHGELIAKGWGDSEELAICDAFLRFAIGAK